MLEIVQNKEELLYSMRMKKWILNGSGQADGYLMEFLEVLYQENKLVKGRA